MNNVIKQLAIHTQLKKILDLSKKHKVTILAVIFLSVIGDILFIASSSDIRTFSLLFLYIVSILIFKLPSKLTFIFSLVLLLTMYIEFLLSAGSVQAEKAAVWLVLFLFVGIIQQWRE